MVKSVLVLWFTAFSAVAAGYQNEKLAPPLSNMTLSQLLAAGSALKTETKKLTDGIQFAESATGTRLGTLGHHGLTQAAWTEINKVRAKASQPLFEYSRRMDYADSSLYCAWYLTINYKSLQDELGRSPRLEELLAVYNRGLGAMEKLGFDWRRLGYSFRIYAARVRSKL